jgi:cytochrome d ubiquinol oxidase subunit II
VSVLAAAVLFTGVLAYAVLGGADYGAGFWDLTAGGAQRGRGPRHLVDESLAPVWEANHVWLIFCLVMLWTAFSGAFAAIMTTLYIPLGLAALGIVVRGSGFAFRKVFVRTEQQRVAGAAFASS